MPSQRCAPVGSFKLGLENNDFQLFALDFAVFVRHFRVVLHHHARLRVHVHRPRRAQAWCITVKKSKASEP